MDYEIGTELLIQSHDNTWISAVVEEDDGDEIFIAYKDGNGVNEWINKNSRRIKPINEECSNKFINKPSCSKIISDFKSIVYNIPTPEKEVVKKPTPTVHSSSIFKVKFKKDDFLTFKTKDSKHKEQKNKNDGKRSDRESKQLLVNKTSKKKHSTNISSNHQQSVENSEMKTETNMKLIISLQNSKQPNETNLLRSENFEESLEDIKAEAEICSPTKSKSRSDIKQKKRRKLFCFKRQPEKRKTLPKNKESRKNNFEVKLNRQKKVNKTDEGETSSKRLKLSFPTSSLTDNSLLQSSSTFHDFANPALLQKIKMDASDEQGFRCPKQECRKLFRKDNLLMMHIKHYHSEYTELLVSTPNVTDLATARIEGENVDEISSPSYYLDRISQLEAKRSVGGTSSCDLSLPSTVCTSSKLTNNEPDSSPSIQSNTSFMLKEKPNISTQAYDLRDSELLDIVESDRPLTETPIKETIQTKEPIKKVTLVDDFDSEIKDNCNINNINNVNPERHLKKKKKKKSDVEPLVNKEVINCSCGINQEYGFMIQCDVCLCWQHGHCSKINSEDQVPDNYICISCLNPSKKRLSKQYDFLQDWIKEGKVASVLQHKDEMRRKDETVLKKSHQLVAEVIEHNNYLQSLLVKTAIYGQTPDHPKLYLWSGQGSNKSPKNKLEELLSGPVPEKPINTSECRKKLLDEIEEGFVNLEARINLIEAKTKGLEDEVNGTIDDEHLSDTITMLSQDLNSMRHYFSLENKNKESEI